MKNYLKTSIHTSSGYFGIDKCHNPAMVKSCCLTSGDYPTQNQGGVEGFTKRTYLLEIEEVEG